jgi:simple sugar transport system ATP-binding protein
MLIVHNPTRGLDFNAVESIHAKLREAAARGCAVVLISSDRDELNDVATRQLFMGRGRLYQTEEEALH